MMKVTLNTLTEQQKRELRRLNNKKAAQRCRERKVAKVKKLESDVNNRNEIIESLRTEIQKYKSSCQLMINYLLSQGVDLRSIGLSEDIIYGSNILTQHTGEIIVNNEMPIDKNIANSSYDQSYSNIKQEYVSSNQNYENSQYQYQQETIDIYNPMAGKNSQMSTNDFYDSMPNSYEQEIVENYMNCQKSNYDIDYKVSKIHIDDMASINQSYSENMTENFTRPQKFSMISSKYKIERPSGFNFNMENLTNEKTYLPLDIVTPQMPLFMNESLMNDYLAAEVHTSHVNSNTCN
ncbi:Basic-leucine zipper domain-containing protein [Strongyloides ratti]|uniref:Basic-leucine zipper domain-containing protein n=1 Tax=Strongyloides ratti TaxID=34506 RepID=A0A090LGY8_STRRB|nr:Basic-leucine zipper domain-containing protein [Strongyloides ratti]CEF69061.1 Basic-leucine zipper domain-containing protein [Strongyloides ratti]